LLLAVQLRVLFRIYQDRAFRVFVRHAAAAAAVAGWLTAVSPAARGSAHVFNLSCCSNSYGGA
jgi:hypothetical protein